MLQSLCTQTVPWLHCYLLVVALLACSCKPLHCGSLVTVAVVLEVYVLVCCLLSISMYMYVL